MGQCSTTPTCRSTGKMRLLEPFSNIFETMVFSTPCTPLNASLSPSPRAFKTFSSFEDWGAYQDDAIFAFDPNYRPAHAKNDGRLTKKLTEIKSKQVCHEGSPAVIYGLLRVVSLEYSSIGGEGGHIQIILQCRAHRNQSCDVVQAVEIHCDLRCERPDVPRSLCHSLQPIVTAVSA